MARFPDTQWSMIRRSGESPSARHTAFSDLAGAYRPAILAFFRARLPPEDAEDATQSFLAASFEHRWWARADARIGSFRGFLLMLLRRHLGHLHAARDPTEPLADADLLADPAPDAERQFDARFLLLLTGKALDGLRLRYRQQGREALFDGLLPLLATPPAHGELQHIATRLGLRPNTLTVERSRLRERLRIALREELRQLCADEAALDTEWDELQATLRVG
ncbi:MAG: hypothetical protein K8F33_00490 [Thermomonas sp.]|uniref:RNA polymerase sigma factor n=1 Tax=Thermomonas sp. TaxID=1971895 RepID=UPI001D9AF011|nr:hypothetical protein [Thermomonas sp.]MBZ0086571.1 hypothetical protein [Thermomonas sp.]